MDDNRYRVLQKDVQTSYERCGNAAIATVSAALLLNIPLLTGSMAAGTGFFCGFALYKDSALSRVRLQQEKK
jgi:hypothetical protein